MDRKEYLIEGRECILYSCDNITCLLIQPVDEHDIELLDEQVGYIADEAGETFALAAFKVNDWNKELSPWEAEPVFGKVPFKGQSEATLSFVEDHLIKAVLSSCALDGDIPIFIGGYSLAALFALWCGYRTGTFTAVAAASPSVWFPGWVDFARKSEIKAEAVYLSLGDKESKTKNKIMAGVGECIIEQYEIIAKHGGIKVILEWNEGNHFKDSDIRIGKAFVWCIKNM